MSNVSTPSFRLPRNGDLSPLMSRMLWELGTKPSITNTHSLVQAFNDASDPKERELLGLWISTYSKWLDEENPIEECDVQVFVHLFNLNCQCFDDRNILRELFHSICKRVSRDTFYSKNLMKVLDYALNKISVHVFGDIPASLLDLIDLLLKKLDGKSFTKDTFEDYGAVLFALYNTVELLKQVCSKLLDSSKYEEIKSRLNGIESKHEYYPIAYHARLIKIGVQKLASGNSFSPMVNAGRRLFYMTVGSFYFTQAIGAIAHLNLDMDAFEASIKNIQKAFEGSFRDWGAGRLETQLETIFQATEIALRNNSFTPFKRCFDSVIQGLTTVPLIRSNWRMLRFCLVDQLRLLALDGLSIEVRNSAIEELVSWGGKCVQSKWSTESSYVFQALLEALHAIHMKEKREQTDVVLREMASTTTGRFQEMVECWLGKKTVDAKLSEKSPTQVIEMDRLYSIIRDKLGLLLTHEDVQTNVEGMKASYVSSEFAEV